MKGKLFNLAPVTKGWAIIGRSDKLIGGCTYIITSYSKSVLELILDESGPLIVYNSSKQPIASEGSVKEIGNGFYRIDLQIGEQNKNIKLSIK